MIEPPQHVGEKAEDFLTPASFIRAARAADPAFRYAIAVAGILAIVVIVVQFGVGQATLVFGAIAIIGLMVLFLLFAQASKVATSALKLPAQVLVWSCLIIAIFIIIFLTTSVFFNVPLPFHDLLIQNLVKIPDAHGSSLPDDSSSTRSPPQTQQTNTATVSPSTQGHTSPSSPTNTPDPGSRPSLAPLTDKWLVGDWTHRDTYRHDEEWSSGGSTDICHDNFDVLYTISVSTGADGNTVGTITQAEKINGVSESGKTYCNIDCAYRYSLRLTALSDTQVHYDGIYDEAYKTDKCDTTQSSPTISGKLTRVSATEAHYEDDVFSNPDGLNGKMVFFRKHW